MSTTVVILAAGKGTRMRSPLPKVLHPLAGRPLLHHVIDCARAAKAKALITVVGHGAGLVKASVNERFGKGASEFVLQAAQRGTGHAVRMALGKLADTSGDVVVLSGDVPLLRPGTVKALVDARKRSRAALSVGTVVLEDAGSYGRIVRGDDGRVLRIVEAKDASPEERALGEINTGLYSFEVGFLRGNIKKLKTQNAQGEYYLTDLVELAAQGRGAEAVILEDAMEVAGVNSLVDLAACERAYVGARVRAMMMEGTRVLSPESFVIDADAKVEPGAFLGANVQLLGKTHVGEGARIEGGAVLRGSHVGAGAHVGANAVLDGATVASGARVGALAYLGR